MRWLTKVATSLFIFDSFPFNVNATDSLIFIESVRDTKPMLNNLKRYHPVMVSSKSKTPRMAPQS